MANVKPIYLSAGVEKEASVSSDKITSALIPELVRTLCNANPQSGESYTILYTPVAITISEVRAVIVGGTSVVVSMYHSATRNSGSPNTVFSSQTINNLSIGNSFTTFTDATVPAGSFIWVVFGTVTGTVTEASLGMVYDLD